MRGAELTREGTGSFRLAREGRDPYTPFPFHRIHRGDPMASERDRELRRQRKRRKERVKERIREEKLNRKPRKK